MPPRRPPTGSMCPGGPPACLVAPSVFLSCRLRLRLPVASGATSCFQPRIPNPTARASSSSCSQTVVSESYRWTALNELAKSPSLTVHWGIDVGKPPRTPFDRSAQRPEWNDGVWGVAGWAGLGCYPANPPQRRYMESLRTR
jgi:hypothetical protein